MLLKETIHLLAFHGIQMKDALRDVFGFSVELG